MDINLLVNLTSRAWSLKILALLHTGVAGRQAPLLAATAAGRTSFGASLQHLIELQLLERNPGHGHPLRPEFRLTVKGAHYAKIAHDIVALAPGEKAFALLRKNWTVPILSVTHSPKLFGQIKHDLGAITDRSLSLALKQMEIHSWIKREVDVTSRPLRATYSAANLGQSVSKIVNMAA
ncbi:winged helix-turn-helix transcriptional regulator [Shimia abyssi]|uniref:HxlR family transcriptional regulator n=1 Tax=Shimia abyssi TaxID=1662395 RepID=A0A2P8FG72_9RHOB|nr:winged helix-turn-helix transcriptional regulator [Shimia abyssi]PSL20712.1 HxlR family transcriptional regulator [Shimia abyssi]